MCIDVPSSITSPFLAARVLSVNFVASFPCALQRSQSYFNRSEDIGSIANPALSALLLRDDGFTGVLYSQHALVDFSLSVGSDHTHHAESREAVCPILTDMWSLLYFPSLLLGPRPH